MRHFSLRIKSYKLLKINNGLWSLTLRATVQTMRDIFDDACFGQTIKTALSEIMQYLDFDTKVEFLNVLLTYLDAISEEKADIAEEFINDYQTKGGTMNFIEAAIQKGKLEGIEEGVEKGKRITAVNSIIANLDDKTIEIITCLPINEIANLRTLYAQYGRILLDMIQSNKI